MVVKCVSYANSKRMEIALDKLCDAHDLKLFAVRGTFVQTPKGIKCIGEVVTILLVGPQGTTPVAVTNDPEYKADAPAQIELENLLGKGNGFYAQILALCKYKQQLSNNSFYIEFAMEGYTIGVSVENGSYKYKFNLPSGVAMMSEQEALVTLYSDCRGIRSFRYTMTTENCEREVCVKNGQTEILKEIAHYLNRGLVITGPYLIGSECSVTCVTLNGCCRQMIGGDGKYHMVKVPFSKFSISGECAVSAVDISFDTLLRSRSVSSAVKEGRLGYATD